MFGEKFGSLLGVAFAITVVAQSCNVDSSTSTNQRNKYVPSPEKVVSPPGPSLRIARRTTETVFFELKNDTGHSIFVSYVPPERGSATKFLGYSLERKKLGDSDFVQYGEGFHHVPNLHPINPESDVSFRLVQLPTEQGEYRVRIGYYEDESVYKMISERLVEMSEAERAKANEARKYVFSESFLISAKSKK